MVVETDRKLATVQRIAEVSEIPGADKIIKVRVLGWECVVPKADNYKVGDQVVYIEIDSKLPERPEFEFLRPRKFIIKTIKLKGQISQGLVMPMSILPIKAADHYSVGQDVTEELDIHKHSTETVDPVSHGSGRSKFGLIKRTCYKFAATRFMWKVFASTTQKITDLFKPEKLFPNQVPKTDETRLQATPNILSKHKNQPFYMTEKLDGQSGTYIIQKLRKLPFFPDRYHFTVASRNRVLGKEDNSNWWKIAKSKDLKNILIGMLKACPPGTKWLAIQGEIVGPGVQGNKYALKELDLFIFSMFVEKFSVSYNVIGQMLSGSGLRTVPILRAGNFLLANTVDEMVNVSKGNSVLNDKTPREGLVFRNYDYNVSFKVINPEFLLKFDS